MGLVGELGLAFHGRRFIICGAFLGCLLNRRSCSGEKLYDFFNLLTCFSFIGYENFKLELINFFKINYKENDKM